MKIKQLQFIVPTEDGDIYMTDYASVDGWKGSHVCTWLPLNLIDTLSIFWRNYHH